VVGIGERQRTSSDTHWTVMFMRAPDAPVRVLRFNAAWPAVLGFIILVVALAALGAWHSYTHVRAEAMRAAELAARAEAKDRRLEQLEAQLVDMEKSIDSLSEREGQLSAYLDAGERPTSPASHVSALERDEALAGLLAGPEGHAAGPYAVYGDEVDLELRLLALAAGAEEQHSHLDELRTAISAGYSDESTEPHLWPVAGGRVTSDYGWRINPITRSREYHRGIDLGAPTGTPIVATADGRVVFAGRLSLYGETVRIQHGDGLETLYAHCHEVAVSVGERVSAGQIIAYVGMTGRSTGPHVHYEVRIDGDPTDPRPYLAESGGG